MNKLSPLADESVILDDRIRGVLPGTDALSAAEIACWR
jgi:hypothetical protein